MKKAGLPLCLILVAGAFFLFFRQDLRQLASIDSNDVETWAYFRSDTPATFEPFQNQIQGAGLTRNRADQILVDSTAQGIVLVPLKQKPTGLLTVHIAADGDPGRQGILSLVHVASGAERYIKRTLDFSHAEFDLTSALKNSAYDAIAFYSRGSSGRYVVLGEFVLRHIPGIRVFPPVDALWLGLGVVLFFFRRKMGKPLPHAILWGLLIVAFSIRWHVIKATVGQDLLGDAGEYFSYAVSPSGMAWAFNHREPLYIGVQKMMGHVWGFYSFQFRLLTVLLSLGSVAASYFLFLKISGRQTVAAAGAALLACGKFMVLNSVRGERTELFLLLMLLYFLVLVSAIKKGPALHALMGLLAGLASLTWLIGAVGASLAYAALAVRNRPPWRSVAVFLVVFAAVLTPHLLHQRKATGDAFYSINAHTNFYKNARDTGQPSPEGGQRSMLKDLVLDQGPKLATDAVAGYFHMFLNPVHPMNKLFLGFANQWSWLLYPFLMGGLFLSVRRRQETIFWLLFSLLNISPAFLMNVFDTRLFLHAAPFAAFFVGQGLAAAYEYIRHRSRS